MVATLGTHQCTKQHPVIEFLSAKGVYPIEIHCWMQVVYGDDCVGVHTVHHWATKPRLGQEKSWLQFLGCRRCYSHGLPWTWDHHQLRVLQCNTHIFETVIKKSSEAQEERFAATWRQASPLEPPQKQLRSCLSPFYDTSQTVQTWCHVISTFFQKWRKTFGHLCDSSEEVERSVRTWMRQQSVEFFRDIFEILVHCYQKCVCVHRENGGELWRSSTGDKRAHFKN